MNFGPPKGRVISGRGVGMDRMAQPPCVQKAILCSGVRRAGSLQVEQNGLAIGAVAPQKLLREIGKVMVSICGGKRVLP